MQPRKIPVIRENAGACASWRICFLCGNYLTSGFGSLGLHLSCGLPDQKFLHQMTGLKGGGERTVFGAAARSGLSRRQTVLRLDGYLGFGCLLRHGLGFGGFPGLDRNAAASRLHSALVLGQDLWQSGLPVTDAG